MGFLRDCNEECNHVANTPCCSLAEVTLAWTPFHQPIELKRILHSCMSFSSYFSDKLRVAGGFPRGRDMWKKSSTLSVRTSMLHLVPAQIMASQTIFQLKSRSARLRFTGPTMSRPLAPLVSIPGSLNHVSASVAMIGNSLQCSDVYNTHCLRIVRYMMPINGSLLAATQRP